MSKPKCLLCNSKRTNFIFNFKGPDIYLEKLKVNNFILKWFRCNNCGVFFSRQHKDIEKVYTDQNLYDAQYDIRQLKIRFRKILGLNEKKSDNAWRVKRIKELHRQYLKYSKTKKNIFKVLDVGAGTGVFLAKFLNTNYKGYALEINKVAARHLRDELRVKVYLGPVNKLKTRNRFDIVTLNKVLEHIKDSRTFLFLLRRFLTPKGIIYAEVPDTLNFKYYGNSSEAFCSGHYMVFSPESLFYLFKRAGYEVLDINRIFEPSGKITIYAFVTRKDNEIL